MVRPEEPPEAEAGGKHQGRAVVRVLAIRRYRYEDELHFNLESEVGARIIPDNVFQEEIRSRDEQVTSSMEQYRIQCENMGLALEECAQKLIGFEIQVLGNFRKENVIQKANHGAYKK